MATAKYPKGSQHPSMNVGEQESTAFKGGKGGQRTYPRSGVASTRYDGDKNKTTKLEGASGGAAKKQYKKSTPKFGTEKGGMQKPCCDKPKAV